MQIINLKPYQALRYKKVLDKDKTYWFSNITHPYELTSLLSFIPDEILDFIKNGSIYLCISNEFESFAAVPTEIYKSIVMKGKVPEHKIVFISGAKNIDEICKRITISLNETFSANLQNLDARFFCGGHIQIASQSNLTSSTKLIRSLALQGKRTYKKHFICLNRRWRLHRPALVASLASKNLLEYGFVSLGDDDIDSNWNDAYVNIMKVHHNHKESYNLFNDNKDKILSIPKLLVDTNDFDLKKIQNISSLNKFYEQSFMSIVTETHFYDYEINFLSEKTFKPISYMQPFILVAIPKSLEMLRDFGYKTFHPFIDESYDSEFDDCQRLMMIVNEIERICTLDQQELEMLSRQIRPICEHNYNLLLQHRDL